MRAYTLLFLFLTGCFRWASADIATLSKEEESTVRITTRDQVVVLVENANVEDGRLVGIPFKRVRPSVGIDLRPPDIVIADPSLVSFEVRRLNGWATAGIITSAIVAAGLTATFIIAAIVAKSSRPVPVGFDSPQDR